MVKLFFLLLSFQAMALTPKEEMRARLATIEDKYSALEECGLLYDSKERSYDKVFDKVSDKLDTEKEACLLENMKKKTKEKKLEAAKEVIKTEDCGKLDTEFLKAVCIVIKAKQ